MRDLIKAALGLAASLLLSACSTVSGFPQSTYDVDKEIASTAPYFQTDVITKYRGLTGGAQEDYRNEVIYNRMRACDVYYDQFIREISRTKTAGSIAADSSVIVLTGVASQIKPAGTAAILSALSGGVVGVKGSVDKEMFYNSTLPVLISQMESGRATVRATIEDGIAQPTSAYALEEALLDVRSYCMAGSIPGALAQVTKNAGAAQTDAEEAIKGTVRSVTYRDNAKPMADLRTSIDALTDDQRLALYDRMSANLSKRALDTRNRIAGCQPVDRNAPASVTAALKCFTARDDRAMSSVEQWKQALRDVNP